jgi:hypothetical protein
MRIFKDGGKHTCCQQLRHNQELCMAKDDYSLLCTGSYKSPDPSVPHALYGTADLRFTVPDCGNRSGEPVTNAGALNER